MSLLRPNRRADRKPQTNYLDFIRDQACLVCVAAESRSHSATNCGHSTTHIWQRSKTEASHTGPHGIGTKSDDRTAIPLCAIHHREGIDAYHRVGEKRFQQIHGINISETVASLNRLYELETGRGESVLNAREVAF